MEFERDRPTKTTGQESELRLPERGRSAVAKGPSFTLEATSEPTQNPLSILARNSVASVLFPYHFPHPFGTPNFQTNSTLLLTLASSSAQDVIRLGADNFSEAIAALPAPLYLLALRLALILILVGFLTGLSFFKLQRPLHRPAAPQIGLACLGLFLASIIPLTPLSTAYPYPKATLFVVATIIVALAPRAVAFFMVTTAGYQKILVRAWYAFVGIAFVFTLFMRESQ
jgi:hypothetical protein